MEIYATEPTLFTIKYVIYGCKFSDEGKKKMDVNLTNIVVVITTKKKKKLLII